MTQMRAAIIGCGPRAHWHAQAYEFVKGAKLVACANRGRQRLNEFSSRFGLHAYEDAAEMLRNENPDIVHLVTGPDARTNLMQIISENNVPACVVEKPLAREVTDWNAIQAIVGTTKTKFAIGHQFRWHKDLCRCRLAIQNGEIGRLRFIDFSAGMNITGQGTHILDYAMSLNDDSPVARVFGTAHGTREMSEYHPGPDTTLAQVLFTNGVSAMWNNGSTSPKVGVADTNWQHVRIAAYGERGHVLWEEFGRWEIVTPTRFEHGCISDMKQWEAGNHDAQARLTESMIAWINDESCPSGTNIDRGIHQWHVVLGVYASALWRRPVDIPFSAPDSLFSDLASALGQHNHKD